MHTGSLLYAFYDLTFVGDMYVYIHILQLFNYTYKVIHCTANNACINDTKLDISNSRSNELYPTHVFLSNPLEHAHTVI